MRFLGRIGAATTAVVVIGLLAACGGGGKPSALEQWQSSVCSVIDDYAGQISGYAQDVRSQLQSPSAGTLDTLGQTAKEGLAATDQLQSQLTALGPPPLENGQTAEQLIDQLAADLRESAARVQREAAKVSAATDLSGLAAPIAGIAGEITAAIGRVQNTIESLQALSGELKDGFDHIDSCKKLQGRFD